MINHGGMASWSAGNGLGSRKLGKFAETEGALPGLTPSASPCCGKLTLVFEPCILDIVVTRKA